MAWTTAIADLRNHLNDNSNDKLRAFHKVLGDLNGMNTIFKTDEFRRITNLNTATSPIGLYVNEVFVTAATDDPESGYFTITPAPANGTRLKASYYIQWFLDSELAIFLKSAANWESLAGDYTQMPEGLQPAALDFAAAKAYQKLAAKYQEHLSATFRMEDKPDPAKQALIDQYNKMSGAFLKSATNLRNDFYTRQGKALQPLFGVNLGAVSDVAPRR